MFLGWCWAFGIHLDCRANRPTFCYCLYWPSPSSLWRSYWSSSAVLRRAKRQADYLVGTALNWYYFHVYLVFVFIWAQRYFNIYRQSALENLFFLTIARVFLLPPAELAHIRAVVLLGASLQKVHISYTLLRNLFAALQAFPIRNCIANRIIGWQLSQ